MRASALAWHRLAKTTTLSGDSISPPIPLETMNQLTPDLGITHWQKKGIKYIQDLFLGKAIEPFNQLCHKYLLPSSEHFNYDHISHCLRHLTNQIYYISVVSCYYFTYPTTKQKSLYVRSTMHSRKKDNSLNLNPSYSGNRIEANATQTNNGSI